MKKTITLAALALGLTTAAFAETSYTLGDITYTTKTPQHGTHGSNFITTSTVTFTLKSDWFANTSADDVWTTSSDNVQNYSGTATNTDKKALVSITSITLYASGNQNTETIPGTITIKDGDTIVATSSSFTRLNDITYDGCLHDGGTWTFSGVNTLTEGKTYTISFSSSWKVAVDSSSAGFASVNGNSGYEPANMTIVTQSVVAATVPEPATATLSLLALAGLATRRRRK